MMRVADREEWPLKKLSHPALVMTCMCEASRARCHVCGGHSCAA